jgi:outer membrane protein OmpA-like peptidoglycan-associated protein
MSPAILRGVLGSCLALGAADLAWLDVNAERMTGWDRPAPAVPTEPLATAVRIERLPAVAPPSTISEEVRSPVAKTESLPSSPQPERSIVHFELGVSIISDDQARMLKPIAEALKTHPKAIVRVEGHADRTGWKRKGNNFALSDERAASIVRALGELGIPRDRMRTEAFGDTRPLDDGSTEEAFRRNRRAEVRIELTGDK